MVIININLTDTEFAELNGSHPKSTKNADIGARALEVVRVYGKKSQWKEIQSRRCGVDLAFVDSTGQTIEMEVKGTAASEIQWAKLRVSGEPCYTNLVRGMPLYRVSSVYDKNPMIHILQYGEDFTMDTEPRWRIKRRP